MAAQCAAELVSCKKWSQYDESQGLPVKNARSPSAGTPSSLH